MSSPSSQTESAATILDTLIAEQRGGRLCGRRERKLRRFSSSSPSSHVVTPPFLGMEEIGGGGGGGGGGEDIKAGGIKIKNAAVSF